MIYTILFNNTLTPQEAVLMLLISLLVFFISLSVHEFAHGLAAYSMGDKTPKLAGRLTLNPVQHLDLFGFIFFVVFGVGWAKPMPVNPLNFKKYKKGMRLVSIAGVCANVVLGLLSAGIYAILLANVGNPSYAMEIVYMVLEYFMLVNSALALFNILPIYSLDGFNFVSTFMKTENKFIKFSLRNGMKILFGILLGSLLIELLFGFDIFSWYLSVLYNYVFLPIAFLGV